MQEYNAYITYIHTDVNGHAVGRELLANSEIRWSLVTAIQTYNFTDLINYESTCLLILEVIQLK